MNRIPFWPQLGNIQRASLVSAVLGFIIRLTTTVSSGGTTVHRDWAALVLGGLTLFLALAGIVEFLRSGEHLRVKLIAFVVAVLVGGLHIARGMGIIYTGSTQVMSSSLVPIPQTWSNISPAATATPSASEHIELGMDDYEQGNYEKAIAEFQKAIQLEPDNTDAHRNLGTAYGALGMLEEAASAYEKAIELDPNFGEAYGDLAGIYVYLGKLPEAIAAGQKAIELTPNYATAHNNLGSAYSELEMIEEAIAEYQEAIRLDPEDPQPHNNLGLIYKSQGRLEEAIMEYKEAIRLDPEDAVGYNHLAVVYYLQGKFEEAIAEWKMALQVDPEHVVVHKNLGIAYRDLGRIQEAVAELETYVQLWPDAPDRAVVEQEIAKLRLSVQELGTEYTNALSGYSLRYPTGWYIAERENVVGISPTKEDYQAASLQSLLITLITNPLAEVTDSFGLEPGAVPEEYLQVMAEKLDAEIGEIIEDLEIAGYPAAVASTSGSLEGTPYRGDLIIILVEERLFLAEALAPPDMWEDFRPTVVDIINSLSFSEPEE